MDYTQFWAQFNSYHSIPIKIIEPVLHLKSTLFLQKYNTEPLLFTYQYLGGEDGVRGYSPNPIENNLAEAKEIMETINTMHFSIELQNTLIRRKDYGGVELGIDWILFSDVGFSADESFEFSMKNSIIGYGLGFRFFASGMGVIGIDFGYNPYGQQFTHLSDEN
jgi:outer membrane protein assembly factor BamA